MTRVSRRAKVESLRALWFFLRKEASTGRISDKITRRSIRSGELAIAVSACSQLYFKIKR